MAQSLGNGSRRLTLYCARLDAYLAALPDARREKFLAAELRRWEALYAQWEANPDIIPDADAYDFALTLAEIGRRL